MEGVSLMPFKSYAAKEQFILNGKQALAEGRLAFFLLSNPSGVGCWIEHNATPDEGRDYTLTGKRLGLTEREWASVAIASDGACRKANRHNRPIDPEPILRVIESIPVGGE